jgi:hypothetical protein
MNTPPPQAPPVEEAVVKFRITQLWWLEHQIRCIDIRTQTVLTALKNEVQNMDSVMTHEYALMEGDDVTMIRMQKGMQVSKSGTKALTAAVTAVPCVNTEGSWKSRMREIPRSSTGTGSTMRATPERKSWRQRLRQGEYTW